LLEIKAVIKKERALEALRLFPEQMAKNVRLATRASLRDIKVGAQQDHAFTSRGGFAEKSITDQVNGNGLGGRVYLDTGIASYAPFLHNGTGRFGPNHKAILIKPVNKQSLRFVLGGKFVFSRAVMNPGIRPDPFLYRSAQKHEAAVGVRFDKAIEKSIKEGGLKK
jgi:hypothetical protein